MARIEKEIETLRELMEILSQFPEESKICGTWEGIYCHIHGIVYREDSEGKIHIAIDVDNDWNSFEDLIES